METPPVAGATTPRLTNYFPVGSFDQGDGRWVLHS